MDKKEVKKLNDLNEELRDYNWVVCATEEDALRMAIYTLHGLREDYTNVS